jgi:hypothetical protein
MPTLASDIADSSLLVGLVGVLGALVGIGFAMIFLRYLQWVRRHHPGPIGRVWRVAFVVLMIPLLFVPAQAAGVDLGSASDVNVRVLYVFAFFVAFMGFIVTSFLRRRR